MELDHYYSPVPEFQTTYIDMEISREKEPTIHYHAGFELDLFVKSDNDLFIKNTRYPLKDSCLLFVRPQDMHIFHYNTGTRYTRFVVSFSMNFLRPYLAVSNLEYMLDRLDTKLMPLSPDICSRMQPLFLAVYKCWTESSRRPESEQTAVLHAHLLLLFLEAYALLIQRPAVSVSSKPAELIRDVVQFLDRSFAEKLTLEQIQGHFFVDKYYLCHIFKKEAGVSIVEYLNCRRIIESQKLLMNTQLPIMDISFACGFSNLQHFYRTFKKYSPYSPSQYRMPKEHSIS